MAGSFFSHWDAFMGTLIKVPSAGAADAVAASDAGSPSTLTEAPAAAAAGLRKR